VLFSLPNLAQIRKASGKVTKIDGRSYITQEDKLFEIDDKAVLVKLKRGGVIPPKLTKCNHPIAMDFYTMSVPDSIDVEKFVLMLEDTGVFEYVEYNCIYEPLMTANDTYISYQWHLSRINANAAWEITTGNPSIKVAVIDNGVELSHEDLYYGGDNYSNLSVAECVDYVSSTDHTPSSSHGTMVAGIIGAKTNNSVGVAGVAGGYGCSGARIISYRTDFTASQLASAVYSAVVNGVKVINISSGGGYSQTYSDLLDYAYNQGVTVVCGSGNDSSSSILFPASHQYTIAVGCTDYDNYRNGSNYGSGLDLVAPSSYISSTCKTSEGKYVSGSGTSLAAPQVAGVAALMLSVNSNLTPSQIRNILRNTCTKLSHYSFTNGWNSEVGYGLLNAFAAVRNTMNLKIVGPQLISTYGTYYIQNLPSGVTTSWKLSDNYYNTHNCLMSNYPSTGHCLITRDNTHDMMDATLTAIIKYNNVTVDSLKLKHLYAYTGFWGQYTSGSLSGNINSSGTFNIKTNTVTTVTSPNFYGATVSYSSSGATPSSWGFNSSSGILNFNTLNTTVPVIINVHDGCGNNYTLYAFPSGSYSINVSNGDGDITVTLVEDGDASKDFTLDEPWTMEITSATTGKVMATRSLTCRSETISTVGWPKGIYIVKVTIGKDELTEKVLVN
jgi:subtilisin family serine protease